MIVLDIFGFHMNYDLPPIVAISSMIGLLALLLTVSKLFFWLVFDMKSPVAKKLVAKQLYATPDVLMQVKSFSPEMPQINNLEPNLLKTKSIWLRIVAVTLAVILCFTQLDGLLNPWKDFLYY